MDKIIIFTDGSCFGNGKKGAVAGIGIHFPNGELKDVSKPFNKGASTNQRAELHAIYFSLLYVRKKLGLTDRKVIINTDSEYSINCLTVWSKNWIKNNWVKSDGEPVLNQDIIKKILVYIDNFDIEFKHVKGHSQKKGYDKIHNDIADKLAVEGSRQLKEQQSGKLQIKLVDS